MPPKDPSEPGPTGPADGGDQAIGTAEQILFGDDKTWSPGQAPPETTPPATPTSSSDPPPEMQVTEDPSFTPAADAPELTTPDTEPPTPPPADSPPVSDESVSAAATAGMGIGDADEYALNEGLTWGPAVAIFAGPDVFKDATPPESPVEMEVSEGIITEQIAGADDNGPAGTVAQPTPPAPPSSPQSPTALNPKVIGAVLVAIVVLVVILVVSLGGGSSTPSSTGTPPGPGAGTPEQVIGQLTFDSNSVIVAVKVLDAANYPQTVTIDLSGPGVRSPITVIVPAAGLTFHEPAFVDYTCPHSESQTWEATPVSVDGKSLTSAQMAGFPWKATNGPCVQG
ncbi:MAG TPA: hypothetical protein VGS21_01370 [Acidimicrobiales bacterium]|nr:hypothetical protein [Acidimicrobiales bacterium]